MKPIFFVIIVLGCLVVVISIFLIIAQKNKPVVLGTQMANASKMEEERIKKGGFEKSPMPEIIRRFEKPIEKILKKV